ncbi:transposase [Nostoc sp. FACHB-888]|nr:transposase [Nostoc sp. FACHB-888]
MLSSIFEQFVKESPVSVMAQALMSHIFAPERMDGLFRRHAQVQYQQDLLFSSLVDLMSLVVCGIQKSVHAAYKARAKNLSVSTTALYNKLCGVELSVSQALVRETAQDLVELVKLVGGEQASILPGYCMKVVDGTCLKGTDHRLKAIRNLAASALPGKAIVVLDPLSKIVTDIFLIEDGHAQERSEFDSVLKKVLPQDLWCGDRNFCTLKFLFKIQEKKAFFVIRQHKGMGFKELEELKPLGSTETGELFEQKVEINYDGKALTLRRVLVKLFVPTRDKEWEIAIFSNLPGAVPAGKIAEIYRNRWTLESLFQTVTKNFNGEIQTIAYPKAALFSFSFVLAAYNILATLRAALGGVHGVGKIEVGLSDFYLVDEIQGTYRGMMIAIPASEWEIFKTVSIVRIAQLLRQFATGVNLKQFVKATRGAKKPKLPVIYDSKQGHISTKRLLEQYNHS